MNLLRGQARRRSPETPGRSARRRTLTTFATERHGGAVEGVKGGGGADAHLKVQDGGAGGPHRAPGPASSARSRAQECPTLNTPMTSHPLSHPHVLRLPVSRSVL